MLRGVIMQYFVINSCPNNGCQHWRNRDRCVKHGQDIYQQINYLMYMHDSDFCQARKQVDNYRLTNLIEEK